MLTDEEIKTPLVPSNGLVVLYFMHDKSTPCVVFKHVVNKIIDSHDGRVSLIIVDVTQRETASNYSVRSVPTVMMFKEGILIETHSGTMSESEFRKMVSVNL